MNGKPPRVIAHVDLDAFYASVEIRDDPSLAGKPVVVGGRSGRGVVAAASYEARRYGIFSAMPMVRAHRLCRDLVVVTPRMDRYIEDSRRFFEILSRYSPRIEGLSLDEAFLDLTGTERLHGPPGIAVAALRRAVRDEIGLACTAGIAPVKFLAKILSGEAKPDGQRRIAAEDVLTFLHALPVGKLWGVGEKRERELIHLGLRTIGDIARADLGILRVKLGREAAEHLRALSEGRDDREVVPDREAKSMGAEETFEHDISDFEMMTTYLLAQAERVAARLRRAGRVATGVTLKYKLSDFKLVTRQVSVSPTADAKAIYDAAVALLKANPPARPIRLIGVSAHRLAEKMADLFDVPNAATGIRQGGEADPANRIRQGGEADPANRIAGSRSLGPAPALRSERLNAAIDGIREKHGAGSVVRASLLAHGKRDVAALPSGYRAIDKDGRPK
jgi:DNA polymerase-4